MTNAINIQCTSEFHDLGFDCKSSVKRAQELVSLDCSSVPTTRGSKHSSWNLLPPDWCNKDYVSKPAYIYIYIIWKCPNLFRWNMGLDRKAEVSHKSQGPSKSKTDNWQCKKVQLWDTCFVNVSGWTAIHNWRSSNQLTVLFLTRLVKTDMHLRSTCPAGILNIFHSDIHKTS